jgi:hypothetical protein
MLMQLVIYHRRHIHNSFSWAQLTPNSEQLRHRVISNYVRDVFEKEDARISL